MSRPRKTTARFVSQFGKTACAMYANSGTGWCVVPGRGTGWWGNGVVGARVLGAGTGYGVWVLYLAWVLGTVPGLGTVLSWPGYCTSLGTVLAWQWLAWQ